MNSRQTYNIPTPMSHITTTPLRQRLLHTSKSSHLLTLILTVTLLAWGNRAWAITIPSSCLDLKNPGTMLTQSGGWTSNVDKGYDYQENHRLIVSAFAAYGSTSKQTWISTDGSSSSSGSWTGIGVFKESSYYHTSKDAKYATTNTSRRYSFRVKNCAAVHALVNSQSVDRKITLEAYEITTDNIGTQPEFITYDKSCAVLSGISLHGLNVAKEYLISVTSDNSSNSSFFEISFEMEDNDESFTATWNFSTKSPATITSTNIQSKTGTVPSDKVGYALYVEATNGKLQWRENSGNHDAQLNVNTIVRVPVIAIDDVVTVAAASGASNININNVVRTSYSAVSADVERGYVEIETKGGTAYLTSITMSHTMASGKLLTVNISPENSGRVDQAGRRFTSGTSVTMTATPNHGYSFSKWLKADGTDVSASNPYTFTMGDADVTYTAVFTSVDLYNLTTNVNINNAGTITRSPNYESYEAKESLTLTAKPNTGYQFVNWTDAGGNEVSTSASYTFDMPAEAKTLTANFKQQKKVTFSKGKSDAEGVAPDYVWCDLGATYTIPKNFSLYKEGQTLTAWNDGSADHAIGTKITVNDDVTLTPVFTPNTVTTLAGHDEDVVVLFNFRRDQGAPIVQAEGSNNNPGIWVGQAMVDGNSIDVKLDYNANPGKFNNASNTDWAQVNNGTTFTVPSAKGAVISMEANADFGASGKTATTINGHSDYTSAKTISYPIQEEGTTATIVAGDDARHLRYIQVRFPAKVKTDLAIKEGQGTINLDKDGSYTLTKGVDYTTTSTAAITFTSTNTNIATVSNEGLITAGKEYGFTYIILTHPETSTNKETSIQYLVRVIPDGQQTVMPTATVSEDGIVTIVKSAKSSVGTRIFYTTDGTAPDSKSTEYTTPFKVEEGTVVHAIAIDGEKIMSDIRQIYYHVAATIKWAWDNGFNATPEITGSAKEALNNGTRAVIGNKLSVSRSTHGGYNFVNVKPVEKANEADENHTLKFNIVPLAGISFKPTATMFTANRQGTDGGYIDAKIVSESQTFSLLTGAKPSRENAAIPYTKYPNTTDTYTTSFASMPMLEEEWALKLYLYSLDNTKNYGFRDITISGIFSGCEFDGDFYEVTASTNPAEGGTAEHTPTASRIMEGKTVTFQATSATGYRFTGWTNLDEENILGTSKTYVVDALDKNTYLEAHFVKLPLITFRSTSDVVTGNVPEEQFVDEETGELFIPNNYTLYREGWYLNYWTDGTNKYYPGNSYRFEEDATLTPVFANSEGKKVTDVNDTLKVKWNFDNKLDPHAAPTIAVAADVSSGSKSTFYTVNANVNSTPIELKMDIDAETGSAKLDNKDARVSAIPGYGCQINNDTKITIPAVCGMKVTIKASEKRDAQFHTCAVFGGSSTVDIHFGGKAGKVEDERTLTYTYTGDESSLQILFNKAGHLYEAGGSEDKCWGFYEYIEVEYPVLPDVLMENRIVTTPLLSDNELAVNAGIVTKSATTHKNTGVRYKSGDEVTITAQAKYGYYISAIKSGETELTMTKVEPSAEAENPTKATATYTVGAETDTVTVEYQRLPMAKVHIESEDTKLGDVDFASSSIHENFYSKGEGWVESWFVVDSTETAISVPADDYVIKNWTSESETGSEVATTNSYSLTVSSAPTQIYFAHFKHGEMGNVVFDITHPVIVEGTTIKALPANFGGMYDANSLAPSEVNNSYSFTIPKYHTVSKTGYTLKFWKNAANDNTYQLGTNHSFQTNGERITLVPVYEANPSDQNNRINDPVMLYEFGTGKDIRGQQVKLEKNTNTYWTAQAYVVTITDGQEHPHYRDIALHVNTGQKGFIRNGDLPEWASFGPGTTFDVASCVGAKVEILSYAPMSSTTFGGKPFTLVSSDEAKHEYVYECTTYLADARVPIVIGDDYSYYKYIKVYSKKANRVNLHIDVDSRTRGRITSVNAINTTVQDPIIELEDGGNSFHQGNSVKVTFKRRFGLEFDKIVDLDKIVNGEPLAVLEMRSDGKVNMVNKNNAMTVETVDANDDGTWGDVSDHVFYLKKTEPTPEEDMVDSLRTTYELSFNITNHRNLQVHFKEKPTYYVTYNAGKQAVGVAPAAAWVEKGDTYRVPDNHTLYYEGNTLKYWIDSQYDDSKSYETNKTNGHVYDIAGTYTNQGSDMLLYPVFAKNTFGLLDIPEGDGLKVTWPFASELGAPYINFERSSGILVSQLKKSSTEWIDLKIDLDGSVRKDANDKDIYGKFNNTSNKDRCQINNNSILSFPTTKDCVIGLSAIKEISTTEIAGMTDGNGYTKGKDVEAIYTGNDATQTVNFTSDGGYYSKFEVTYKHQNATKPQLTSVKYGEVTLSADDLTTLKSNKVVTVTVDPDVENDAIPEITATADNNGEVLISQATISNRSAVITLKTEGGVLVETYSVNFQFNPPTTAPQFKRFIVNGVVYKEGDRQIKIENLPVSGTITLVFDHTMAESSIPGPKTEITYTAKQSRELVFNYWNLPVNLESTLTFPASHFSDVYGKAAEGENLQIKLTVSSTTMTTEHRTFDFIVGKDGDINDAITSANDASGDKRFYVFIPDGEHELKGNQEITSNKTSDGVAPADSTGVNRDDLIGQTFNNGMTQITRANVSLIGQSTNGVTLFNRPLLEGIGYTATIHIGKNATDFYAEDLQLVNRFPYWKSLNAQGTSGAGRAVAFWDQGNRSIMKNVEMWSYQDTYYSSNANDNYRGYFENCTIAGVVDFLCGDGNIWLEKCDIVLRDRAGNNIAAPSQENTQQWGYVFNECNIKPEVDNAKDLKDKNWSLARPWANDANKSPAATYLNTKMWLMPRDAGWEKMGTGAILRFHEYKTMDKSGTLISLGSRSLAACAPGAGSDDCILSAADASKYTIENVLGGGEAFDPVILCQQIDASSGAAKDKDANNSLTWNDEIEIDDDHLQWNTEKMALCYFVFKKVDGRWIYQTNVAQSTEDEKITGLNLERYGSGFYCVRAANQRGGLGAPTKEIEYTVSQKYTLTINEVGNEPGHGWSTICLPYNSKVPAGLTIYAANGKASNLSEENKVDNYTIYLDPVQSINKNVGYVVYGPVGQYTFSSSSHESSVVTILGGNPSEDAIPVGNNNCYVLANKTTYGLGFYKFTGTTLAPYRAWLPADMVTSGTQTGVNTQAKAIKMVFTDENGNTTAIGEITADGRYEFRKSEIYDLNGIRIQTPVRGRVYIINGVKRQWK